MAAAEGSRRALVARIVLSLLVLACALLGIDLHALAGAMLGASPRLLLFGALLLAASIALAGVVWHAVFPAALRPLGLVDSVRHTVVGASLNALLPTSGLAGDVYRAWACIREGGSAAVSACSVIMARWCSLVSLALSLWVVYGLVAANADTAAAGRACLAVAAAATLICAAVTVLLVLAAYRPPPWLADRRVLGVAVREVSALLLVFGRSPLRLAWAVLLSALAVWLEGCALYSVALGVGAGAHGARFVLLGPAIRLVHQVPGFFNAVGVQEVAMLTAGGLLGVQGGVSIAISLVMHAIRVGVALLGLPLYLTSGFVAADLQAVGKSGPNP